jgi:cobalamin biosynthesis protein CobT
LDAEDFDIFPQSDARQGHEDKRDSSEQRPSLQRATEHLTPKESTSKHSHHSSGDAGSGQGAEHGGEAEGGCDDGSVDYDTEGEEDAEKGYAKYATAFSLDTSDMFDEDQERAASLVHPHIAVATEVPFEYQAFEAIFETVITVFNQEFVNIAAKLRLLLHKIKDASLLSLRTQEKMASLKSRVAMLLAKVIAHRAMLEEAMNDEEVMALMNLSRLRVDPGLYMYVFDPLLILKFIHVLYSYSRFLPPGLP